MIFLFAFDINHIGLCSHLLLSLQFLWVISLNLCPLEANFAQLLKDGDTCQPKGDGKKDPRCPAT